MEIRKAPELRPIADELITDTNKHLGHLLGVYLFFHFADEFKGRRALHYGKVEKPGGLTALLLLGRLSDSFHSTTGNDCFLITLNHKLWKYLKTEREKQQVLYHYLLRCHLDDEKLETREADYAIFDEEVRVWGEDLPNIRHIMAALERQGQEELEFGDDEDAETENAPTPMGPETETLLALGGGGIPGQLALPGAPLLALPAPPDPNVIDGEFREEVPLLEAGTGAETEATADVLDAPTPASVAADDTLDESGDTPSNVTAFLEKTRVADYGASEEDVPMASTVIKGTVGGKPSQFARAKARGKGPEAES